MSCSHSCFQSLITQMKLPTFPTYLLSLPNCFLLQSLELCCSFKLSSYPHLNSFVLTFLSWRALSSRFLSEFLNCFTLSFLDFYIFRLSSHQSNNIILLCSFFQIGFLKQLLTLCICNFTCSIFLFFFPTKVSIP